MIRRISIDPGLDTGIAFWGDKRLIDSRRVNAEGRIPVRGEKDTWQSRAFLVSQRVDVILQDYKPHIVVIEKPFFSQARSEVAKTGSLVKLCILTGLIARSALDCTPRVRLIDVNEWKGNLPKDISHRRIRVKISGTAAAESWHLLTEHEKDAIGLGLYSME